MTLDGRLVVRVDDYDTVNAVDGERLLDDLLDDGETLDGEKLLGNGLGGREKTGAESGGGDDCLHDAPFNGLPRAQVRAGNLNTHMRSTLR